MVHTPNSTLIARKYLFLNDVIEISINNLEIVDSHVKPPLMVKSETFYGSKKFYIFLHLDDQCHDR